MTHTLAQIQEVARHYIIAALWADADEGTHPQVPAKTRADALTICKAFIERHPDLFAAAMQRAADGYGAHPDAGGPEGAFGHDLWLTTRGHGCGFWDRDELDADDLGRKLTDAGKAFGEPAYEFYRGWFYLRPDYSIDRDARMSALAQGAAA